MSLHTTRLESNNWHLPNNLLNGLQKEIPNNPVNPLIPQQTKLAMAEPNLFRETHFANSLIALSVLLHYALWWYLLFLLCCVVRRVRLFVTPWTIARQAPLSMEFARQESWSGFPCPTSGDLPNPEAEHTSLAPPALTGKLFTTVPHGKPRWLTILLNWVKLGKKTQ